MWIEKRTAKDGRERYRAIVRRQGYPPISRTFGLRRDAEEWGIEQERRMMRERVGLAAPASRAQLSTLLKRYQKAVTVSRVRARAALTEHHEAPAPILRFRR